MPTETIDSLSGFIEQLSELRGGDDNVGSRFWFRGHANHGWELLPGVLREEFAACARQLQKNRGPADERAALEATEKTINTQFRRQGSSLLSPGMGTVEIYFYAEHHGLPTRLLDWTANPLAALFFAAAQAPHDDGEVVAIRPDWSLTFGTRPPPDNLPDLPLDQRNPLVAHAIDYLFDLGERPTGGLILPIQPDLRTARMLQQGACFTFHLPDCPRITDNERNCRHFVVPRERKMHFVNELRALGINWATLFPDLDYLAREIREHWRLPAGTQ